MIFVPKITHSISPDIVGREDHCLVVLPTTNGRTDFISVRSYKNFLEYFGSEFTKPESVDHTSEVTNYIKSEEEYNNGLRNTIKYLLDNNVPLLMTTASVSTKASVRIYAEDKEDYSICSISHGPSSIFMTDEMTAKLKQFITLSNLKNHGINRTLVHRIPLHTKMIDGVKHSVVPDPTTFTDEERRNYRGWFITLPTQTTSYDGDKVTINTTRLPYLIYLNNSDKSEYVDIYATTTPLFDGKNVAVLNCAGTREQLAESISRINNLLQLRYDAESAIDPTVNHYRLILDWDADSIIVLSNQYVPYSAVNSLPYGDEFYPDLNDSGWIMEKFTQPYAYLDVESNYTGDIGNQFNITLIQSDDFLIRLSYGASIYEYIPLYEMGHDFITKTDYVRIKQYAAKTLSDGSTRNILFDGVDSKINQKVLALFGGVNAERVTYDDIRAKINEYSDLDDTYPINHVFDCMSESQEFIYGVADDLTKNFSNKCITLLANCYTPIYAADVNSKHKLNKLNVLYYHPYLVHNTYDEPLSLAAYIIISIMRDNYIPTLTIIGHKDYIDSITPSDTNIFGTDKWTYVTYPSINGSYLYLNEMKIARMSYEESIDTYISCKLHNELSIMLEPLIGESRDTEALKSMAIDIISECQVSPSLISSLFISDFERSGRSLNITVSAYRQALAGGTRILNINIIL